MMTDSFHRSLSSYHRTERVQTKSARFSSDCTHHLDQLNTLSVQDMRINPPETAIQLNLSHCDTRDRGCRGTQELPHPGAGGKEARRRRAEGALPWKNSRPATTSRRPTILARDEGRVILR